MLGMVGVHEDSVNCGKQLSSSPELRSGSRPGCKDLT